MTDHGHNRATTTTILNIIKNIGKYFFLQISIAMDTEAIASRTKDCSKGFCTLYCRQWCYIIFPPPPPPFEDFPDDQSSGPSFSTLFITAIGILAGALLLISYYAIVSKYCRNRFLTPRPDQNSRDDDDDVELGLSDEPHLLHEPWFVATNGLEEALITSLTMFVYKKGEGLVEGTDCSVCLNEFVEDERLRLLPKCSHAFHVQCIDTWLTCHSNCPLCRANVAGPTSSPPSALLRNEPVQSSREVETSGAQENLNIRDQDACETMAPKTPRRERRDDDEGRRGIRRSVSMDCVSSVKDGEREESNRQSTSRGGMKRSHSSGRWFASKWGKANSVIPY